MSFVDSARSIAYIAHRGQTDKAGNAYIDHPKRVAHRVARENADDITVAAAWLHDVVEDTDITLEDLFAAGIPESVLEVVQRLTRKEGQSPEDYYEDVRGSTRALRVKKADIADNTDIRRLALLEPETQVRLIKKYAKALDAIGV